MNYLTPAGFERLRSELTQLLDHERPKVVRQVAEAAAQGDRSENAEYIYGKRRLREIDRRIRFLQGRLDKVEIVDPRMISTERVSFGAWVCLEDEAGEQRRYQLVGQDEIDPDKGRITFQSPLGRALLGKSVGAVVEVQTPKGRVEYELISIEREP